MYGKMQEVGFVKILPEMHLPEDLFVQSTEHLVIVFDFPLSEALSALSVGDCSRLIFVDLDGERNALCSSCLQVFLCLLCISPIGRQAHEGSSFY